MLQISGAISTAQGSFSLTISPLAHMDGIFISFIVHYQGKCLVLTIGERAWVNLDMPVLTIPLSITALHTVLQWYRSVTVLTIPLSITDRR